MNPVTEIKKDQIFKLVARSCELGSTHRRGCLIGAHIDSH
jgi:hypothetical protein